MLGRAQNVQKSIKLYIIIIGCIVAGIYIFYVRILGGAGALARVAHLPVSYVTGAKAMNQTFPHCPSFEYQISLWLSLFTSCRIDL
jgi:hypothetical protein